MLTSDSKKSSSRSGRFKKKLVSKETLQREASKHLLPLKEMFQLLKRGQLSEAEFVASYILLFLSTRYPKTWLGHFRPLSTHLKGDFSWKDLPFHFSEKSKEKFLKHNINSVIEIINCFNFKSTPEVVRHSLLKWSTREYSLELMFYVPSPLEVLHQQQHGKRCVTTFMDEKISQYILGQRDALSFTLHDLIHAHHFFKNKNFLAGQIGFYRMLLHHFDDFPLDHQDFYPEFEYLMSDMNAYPIHLLKCLSSSLSHHFTQEYFLKWAKKIKAPHVFQLLNSSAYNPRQHDEILLNWLKDFPPC